MHQKCDQRYFLITAEIYWKGNRIKAVNTCIMCPDGIFIPYKVREYIKNEINKKKIQCDCVIISNVFELSSREFFQGQKEKNSKTKVRPLLRVIKNEEPPKKSKPNLAIIKDKNDN